MPTSDLELTPEELLSMDDEEFAKLDENSIAEGEEQENEEIKDSPPSETPQQDVFGESESDGREADDDVPAPPPLQDSQLRSFYESVMAPFKANGVMIQPQSVDEVIRLMQMGANYTKKMQNLQPQRKLLMMLENNNLLDEDKIGFLIDVHNRDPEAIKKLLADADIDPLDLDTSNVNYQGNNHSISDQEAAFSTALKEVQQLEGGRQSVEIMAKWDSKSKDIIYENPEILQILHNQRMSGIFDIIAKEIQRRQTIGALPAHVPFLHAYKSVGDELTASGALEPTRVDSSSSAASNTAPTKPSGTPVTVRAGRTPRGRSVDTRVKAAAPTRTSRRSASKAVNYLSMSDEDFLKMPPP